MTVDEKMRPPAEDGTDGTGGMYALPWDWPPEAGAEGLAGAAGLLDC